MVSSYPPDFQPSAQFKKNITTGEEQRALYAEQVDQLYSNALLGMLATVIISLVLALIQRDVTPGTTLIVWVAVLAVISLLRYGDTRAFRRRSPQASEVGYWRGRFIVGLALSGMAWGSSAIFLFPIESLAHQIFLVFVIGGMVAGAAAAFSSVMKAFLAYSVPALGPIVVRLVLLGDEFHLAMGGMALLFGVMMFIIARRIKTVRDTSVKLRFENTGLVSYLTALERTEKALREAHDELELRVEERTGELRNAYESLKVETKEREQAESQLRQAQKMEAIGTLAGGVAHDFNNMLAIILGNAELALDDLDGKPEARGNIEQIVKASKRATGLVRQILAFSRKTEPGKNSLMLAPLVKETYQLLRGALPSTINTELDLNAASDAIIGDPSQIQQVLMNLATNAAHAMEERGGTLLIGLSTVTLTDPDQMPEPDMQPGCYVKLCVKDTGTGMAEDVQRRMFEPFFTTKELGKGTGMGLAVAYGIVRSHGGAISVESKVGEGSNFAIVLPCAGAAEKKEQGEAGGVPLGTERILLVDDEPAVAEMASRTLRRLGYEVTSAISGRAALETFLKEPARFDLVITDQTMPDLTGIDLAQRMLQVRKDLPVILITGHSETVSPEKATSVGISEFVMKPVSKREMAETVRRVLDRRDSSS